MDSYEIIYEGSCIGNVEVVQKGLYYRIQCRCKPIGKPIKILLHCGEIISLGTCVPKDNCVGFDTRIATKRICGAPISFSVDDSKEKRFVPIAENEPFQYISQLMRCRFATESGVPGIILPK